MADDFDEDDEGAEGNKTGGKVIRSPSKPNKSAIRPRIDGFTPDRQRSFFAALRKTGCIKDACRAAGISKTTVGRWRDKDEAFDEKVKAARALAAEALDVVAWKRATEGTKEEVWRDGKLVSTRIKQSDSMLRLLMQGADPERYGRTGPMPREDKHLETRIRTQIEQEVRAEDEAEREALVGTLMRLFDMLKQRDSHAKLGAGWTPGPDGKLVVPPGWRMVPEVPLLPPPARS